MFPWQRFLAGHTVLCREIELQELRSYVSPLQDIKVDSPDSGLRSFAGHLTGPASTSSGLCCWKLRSGTFPPVGPESWGVGVGVRQLCKRLAQISLFISCVRTRGWAKIALILHTRKPRPGVVRVSWSVA